ncbi:unnamed protein product [Rotaria sp. Silwood1]|nr:unnamed protein product [Rotaria sp. Silwood1]CAF4801877.1 unnamed protein product [Rotaria sp. Silwood1]
MSERKAFNIIKTVPVLGQAYGAMRGLVYAAQGDMPEARHSVSLDLADLNPLRIPRNLANGIVSATNDLEQDAWIGKRPIGRAFIGLNILPGVDGLHWSIQINGIIYQLVLDKNNQVKVLISSKNERAEWYERDCKEYSWYLIQKELPYFDSAVLKNYAKSFEAQEYQRLIATGDKINCQSFVTRIIATAANISIDKARICKDVKRESYFIGTNSLINRLIEPARPIEDRRGGTHFLNIIVQSTTSICEWNTNQLDQGNNLIFVKIALLIIYMGFNDILTSTRSINPDYSYYNDLKEFFILHAVYNRAKGIHQLNLENCYHDSMIWSFFFLAILIVWL